MRIRAALLLSAMLLSGCADAIDVLAPHVFYGYVTAVDERELCLGDARTQDLDQERCFRIEQASVPGDLRPGQLVRVAYERDDEDDVAVGVQRHGRR